MISLNTFPYGNSKISVIFAQMKRDNSVTTATNLTYRVLLCSGDTAPNLMENSHLPMLYT